MITVTIVNIIAVFFASLVRKNQFKYGLEVAFIIIAIFLSLRYDFGNDYMAYYKMFYDVGNLDWILQNWNGDVIVEGSREIGWVFMCWLFKPIGFFGMVAVLSCFQCWVYYQFIKRYVPKELYWFAILVYVFSAGLMLTHSSMMRQGLSVALFVLSTNYIFNKKWLIAAFLIFIAYTFHKSAMILFPFIFIGYLKNININKTWQIALIILYIVLVTLAPQFQDSFVAIALILGNDDYIKYYNSGTVAYSFGLGGILNYIILAIILFSINKQDILIKSLFLIFIIGQFTLPLAIIAPGAGRLNFYFSIFSIAVYPLIYYHFKNSFLKYPILGIILLLIFYSYFEFFQSEIWIDKFSTYQTIFSA
ncbi:MAG: EpsG family protein [Muribaculaceae bacterium]